MRLGTLTLAVLLAACGGDEGGVPAHVTLGLYFVAHVDPAFNRYDSPAVIEEPIPGQVHAVSKCGSFVSELLAQAYPELASGEVLLALTGMRHADAAHWYDAIASGARSGGHRLVPVVRASDVRAGDLFASRYDSGDATGHVLVILGPPYPTPSGGLAGARAFFVEVLDSSQSPHGDDTRAPDGEGIGRGWLRLYLDDAGALVAWQWGLDASAEVYDLSARPVALGRLDRP